LFRFRLLILNALLLLALLGSHWGRRVENATVAHKDFLRQLQLPFHGWTSSEVSLSSDEQEMLQPDASLIRRYQAPTGQWAELAVIAGHRKKSIHTPGFCMAGGGWETITQQGYTLSLDGHEITATRSLMTRDNHQVLLTYFFTDGEFNTCNLIQFQGMQVLKRLQSRVPVGALVRILVPVDKDTAEAERLSDEFAHATLPGVLQVLRNTRLNAS
jgi:EpsI family protein